MYELCNRLVYMARSMSWMVDPRFLLRSLDYPIDRPIFLLGTQGGGLTLLSRMFRRHRDVVSAAGNCHYWTSADEIQNVYGPALPPELTGLRYKAPPDNELPPPRSWTYAVGNLYHEYRKTASDATQKLRRSLERVIRYSVRRYAIDPCKARFVDKSQVYSVRVGLINELLKDYAPRFILVPREPYVSVFRAANGKAGDMHRLRNKLPLSRRVELCAEHYANSMKAVFEDCNTYNIDCFVLPFEQLLRQPENSLRRVCEFVELDFNVDMLPSRNHRFPIGSRFADRWYPLRTNVNDGYETRLDTHTIETVNGVCGDIIAQLGYPLRRVSPSNRHSSVDA